MIITGGFAVTDQYRSINFGSGFFSLLGSYFEKTNQGQKKEKKKGKKLFHAVRDLHKNRNILKKMSLFQQYIIAIMLQLMHIW